MYGHAPDWASAWGQDRSGPYAAFQVGAIEYLLRWIPEVEWPVPSPVEGLLQMEYEPGFWVGERPLSLPLWRAVVQENRGTDEPSEDMMGALLLDWDEVMSFLDMLNSDLGRARMRLPTQDERRRYVQARELQAVGPEWTSHYDKDLFRARIVCSG